MLAIRQFDAEIKKTEIDNVTITADGSKHIFVYAFIYALFSGRKVVLNNVPAITDTEFLLEYAVAAGAEIEYDRDKKKIIVYEKVKENLISTPMVVNCRSSLLVLAMHYMEFSTARMINAVGGCQLGERKIDQHIRLWNCLGAKVSIGHEISLVKEIESLHSFGFELDTTMGSICALYAMEKGLLRTADNISVRPEVLDLCNFLSCFGRRIKIIGRKGNEAAFSGCCCV